MNIHRIGRCYLFCLQRKDDSDYASDLRTQQAKRVQKENDTTHCYARDIINQDQELWATLAALSEDSRTPGKHCVYYLIGYAYPCCIRCYPKIRTTVYQFEQKRQYHGSLSMQPLH